MLHRAYLVVAALAVTSCGGGEVTSTATSTTTTTVVPVVESTTTTSTTSTSTTTTTTLPIEILSIEGERSCPGWIPLAREVGWPEDQLDKLSFVMWRESRCQTLARNSTDPVSGSRGLTQVNGYWCRPSKWSENGWLQDRNVLSTCDDLYDAETNLRAALLIWFYGVEKGRTGWGPWAV